MDTIKIEFLKVFISNLEEEVKVLELYLRSKLEQRDFHAVQDAAADIRELEAKIATVQHLILVHTKGK